MKDYVLIELQDVEKRDIIAYNNSVYKVQDINAEKDNPFIFAVLHNDSPFLYNRNRVIYAKKTAEFWVKKHKKNTRNSDTQTIKESP